MRMYASIVGMAVTVAAVPRLTPSAAVPMSAAAILTIAAIPIATAITVPVASGAVRPVVPIKIVVVEVIATFVGMIAAAIIVAALIAAVRIVGAIVMPAAATAEHAACARIRIQPDDSTFGRHPLHAIVHLSVATHERTFGVVETSRMVAADFRKNSVERFGAVA